MDAESGLIAPKKSSKGCDIFLAFSRLLCVLTISCSLLCAVAHAMAFVVGPVVFQDLTSLLIQTLRVYGLAFSLFNAMVETEWEQLIVHVRLMENWVLRALFQIFLAALTMHVAVSDGDDDFLKSLQLYRKISAMFLLGCASVYLMSGCLCLGYLKQRRMRKLFEVGRLQEALHSLEIQEKEIRKTLARYSAV